MDEVTRRFLVLGKVQGVYFRHGCRLEAIRLAIRGHAQNLPDGSVDVLACGAPASVEELHRWLKRGPARARVDEVRETPPGHAGPFPGEFSIF